MTRNEPIDERKRFEDWSLINESDLHWNGVAYINPYVENSWQGWISRAKLDKTSALIEALLRVRTDLLRTDFKSEADRWEYMLSYITPALAQAAL
jgi:hypothetical protein